MGAIPSKEDSLKGQAPWLIGSKLLVIATLLYYISIYKLGIVLSMLLINSLILTSSLWNQYLWLKKHQNNHEGPETFSGFLEVTQLVGGGPRIWNMQLDSRGYTKYHVPLNVA